MAHALANRLRGVRRRRNSLVVGWLVGWCCAIHFLAATGVRADDSSARPAPVERIVSFHDDVIPVLTRFGCNSGGCHGKLAGQNGFKLSLRGYAPELDFDALARESHGRRVNPAAPAQSLLIRKAVQSSPHGGGRRFDTGSPAEAMLVDWIRQGMPGPRADEPSVERLELTPVRRTLATGEEARLQVDAIYSDGRRRDVTWLAQFATSDSSTLAATEDGVVRALRPGETSVRATFRGHVAVATFTTPYPREAPASAFALRRNAIDDLVLNKLAELRIEPSPLCDDATFLRRASLDATGLPPTPEQVRAFLSDARPDKRDRLIDDLLERPEFVDYWAHWLGDLLQNRKERDHDIRGVKGVRAMHQWLRDQLIARRSWRDIASAVLTAQGASDAHPPVGYFIVTVGEREAEQSEAADSVAQAFLGARIGCARCHNHPLERFTQDDYYHFVGFFSRVALDRRKSDDGGAELFIGTRHQLNLRNQQRQQRAKLAELESAGGDPAALEAARKQLADLEKQSDAARDAAVRVRQPRTGVELAPRPLDRSPVNVAPGQDPREALVAWMTDPKNEYFAGAMVNRLWKHFLGVGLVEPVDDLRATNPPSNEALWKHLVEQFVADGYDLRAAMRRIMQSRTYQTSAATNESNFRDRKFNSHFHPRRLPAEVLLDAICQATDQPEAFAGYPLGMRAVQVPDPFAGSYFLSLFGRSARTTACACERENDVTLPQLLHLQNGDGLHDKIKAPTGRLQRLIDANVSPSAAIEELFLATVGRPPTAEESGRIEPILASGERREALIDLFWALLNSKEFTFNH